MTRFKPLRFLLLLSLFAASLLFYEFYPVPPREATFVQQGIPELPEVAPPTGTLSKTFAKARPATLQIEIGSSLMAFSNAPLGVGTGFFISKDGLVLTAYHVIDAGSGVPGKVTLSARGPGGKRYPLELVGFDAYRDLALLRAANAKNVPYLEVSPRDPVVGSSVVAIGNSRGDFLQGRAGEVRRLNVAAVQASFADGTFELTAALAPGDSGGPVLDEAGRAVGVVSYIAFTPRRTLATPRSGLFPLLELRPADDGYAAYAVPVVADSAVLAALRAGEARDVPVIGFTIGLRGLESYDPASSGGLELGPSPGVIVGQVAPGGPAARAGLRDAVQRPVADSDGTLLQIFADVIVSVDGERTPTSDALVGVLRRKQVGQTVAVEIARGDSAVTLDLELGGRRAVFSQAN